MADRFVITRTPHRVGFLGGGTDLPEISTEIVGAVLTAAIDRYVYVTVKLHSGLFDERYRLQYSETESCSSVAEIKNDIIRNTLQYFEVDTPLVISTMSDLPAASGMGSSSSFAVGLVSALNQLFSFGISDLGVAEVAFTIERSIPGSLAGRQDMYAAVFGGLNLFEFGDSVKCSHVACSDMLVNRFFPSLRLAWTGTQRQSSSILATQISLKDQKLSLYREMKALAYEGFELVNDMQDLSSIKRFGALLERNAELKYDLSPSIFPESLKRVLDMVGTKGLVATKLLGAGGGGFILCLFDSVETAQLVENQKSSIVWLPLNIELGGVSILQQG